MFFPHPVFGGSNGKDGKLHLPGITIRNPFAGSDDDDDRDIFKVNDPGGKPPLEVCGSWFPRTPEPMPCT